MTNNLRTSLDWLRDLGSPAELQASARQAAAPRFESNAHIHLPPNFSAFDSVEQAVTLAKEQGISVLGASNYYDYDVYAEFADLARGARIFPLFGLEIIARIESLVREGTRINDPGNPGKIYVCGKGITRLSPMSAEASRLLGIIRRNDSQRMAAMIAQLEAIFSRSGASTGLSEQGVIDRVVARHAVPRQRVFLQERHVCQAFQECFFDLIPVGGRMERLAVMFGAAPEAGPDDAVGVQGEIRSHLMKSGKPAFVEETFVSFDEARRLVLELGGIPCYPTLADGTRPICPFEEPVGQLVERIKGMGMSCAELIPVRNSPDVLAKYVLTMRKAGLVVTAGTEHNTLDRLSLVPRCLDGREVPGGVREIFREGACVVAAHQFMVLHGHCGFVDDAGRPNAKYTRDDQRIAEFSRLGAAVIARYQEALS